MANTDDVDVFEFIDSDDEAPRRGKTKSVPPIEIPHDEGEILDIMDLDEPVDLAEALAEAQWYDLQARASSLPPGHVYEDSVDFAGFTLTPGTTVELHEQDKIQDFLRIEHIVRDFTVADEPVYLRGLLLRRTREMDTYLPRKRNELCLLIETDRKNPKDPIMVRKELKDIVSARTAIFTNLDFPELSFRHDSAWAGVRETDIKERGPLVCRWKHQKMYDMSPGERSGNRVEELFSILSPEECDKHGISGVVLRRHWRGRTSDVAGTLPSYTYGDVCAGAGGNARGAKMSGLKVIFLLDHDKVAVDSLRLNFPRARIIFKSIFDHFSSVNKHGVNTELLDILHISYPCQPHSPVHTRPGKNDASNTAALYSVEQILLKHRPRILTLEQTPGILTKESGLHFRGLIHQITAMNYSLRWRVINFAEYGNVQPRKRLVIVAAGPGEKLPEFPKPTHGPRPQLPLVTIKDVLGKLARDRIDLPISVQPSVMNRFSPKNESPYNPSQQLKNRITCNGGYSDLHPTGTRSFTLQELAALQYFPIEHRFSGSGLTAIRRQIGNAVPPIFAKKLYEAIIPVLRQSDREEAGRP